MKNLSEMLKMKGGKIKIQDAIFKKKRKMQDERRKTKDEIIKFLVSQIDDDNYFK